MPSKRSPFRKINGKYISLSSFSKSIKIISCFILFGLFGLTQDTWASQQPNIVIVLADDLDDVATPAYFRQVMPFLDSLRIEGISFRNSFVPTSVCCPGRASLLTGKYGYKTGVLSNGGPYGGRGAFIDNEPQTLAAILAHRQYRTAIIGKYLNGFDYKKNKQLNIPYGWTDGAVHISPKLQPYKGYDYYLLQWKNGTALNDTTWQAVKQKVYYGKTEQDYSTDVFAQLAVAFINEANTANHQPFFLLVAPTAPHFPLPPAPRHKKITHDTWQYHPTPSTPNTFHDGSQVSDISIKQSWLDKPWWLQKTWKKRIRQSKKGRRLYNTLFSSDVPRSIHRYLDADWYNRMGSLYALDELLRLIITTLKKNGQWENTILIFTSDNGYQFGSHGLYQKSSPYEESIKVPLIIAAGNQLSLKKGTTIDSWIANIDLMPTLLELAGIPIPDDIDGQSFLPLLQVHPQRRYEARNKLLLEYEGPGMAGYLIRNYRLHLFILPSYFSDIPAYKAIRIQLEDTFLQTKIYKYIEWIRFPRLNQLRWRYTQAGTFAPHYLPPKRKRMERKLHKSFTIEKELYDLTNDPYELDNLLYYDPEKYQPLVDILSRELRLMTPP